MLKTGFAYFIPSTHGLNSFYAVLQKISNQKFILVINRTTQQDIPFTVYHYLLFKKLASRLPSYYSNPS